MVRSVRWMIWMPTLCQRSSCRWVCFTALAWCWPANGERLPGPLPLSGFGTPTERAALCRLQTAVRHEHAIILHPCLRNDYHPDFEHNGSGFRLLGGGYGMKPPTIFLINSYCSGQGEQLSNALNLVPWEGTRRLLEVVACEVAVAQCNTQLLLWMLDRAWEDGDSGYGLHLSNTRNQGGGRKTLVCLAVLTGDVDMAGPLRAWTKSGT